MSKVFHRFSGIRLLTLLILCALALSNMGCDGGVGEVAVVDGVATDAAATAAADAAAETAADAVTETAIAGSTDIALDLGGDIATVEPFGPALEAGDSAEDMVAGLSSAEPDGTTITELDNKTGDLQMVTLTTRSIYQAEKAYLDVQHNRLIMQAIEKRGDAPTWGCFKLGDKAVSDLQQAKKIEFTGSDGNPVVFELQR
ncbi:MAG: hypothetical protein M3O30_12125 [Planctomycetota bacterium]|nr:hypothetical protein [Planctomycetota bacterium]